MGLEIERKFLLANNSWKVEGTGTEFRQGYLSTDPDRNVRVRVKGAQGFLTVKGRAEGITRLEFEYEIPLADAANLLESLCEQPLIEKTRYRVEVAGDLWEIDEFHGDNQGLVVAEIELESEGQEFEKPAWLGEEVSHDTRYLNSNLARRPFTAW